MKTEEITTADRIAELAKFLSNGSDNYNLSEIQQDNYTDNLFTTPDGDFLVLTDDEANAKAAEEIENSLWAFNAEFILDQCELNSEFDVVDSLRAMQEKTCELCNDFIRALIDGTCGLSYFTESAIDADGRGNFLSPWDGKEIESGNFYIYRVN